MLFNLRFDLFHQINSFVFEQFLKVLLIHLGEGFFVFLIYLWFVHKSWLQFLLHRTVFLCLGLYALTLRTNRRLISYLDRLYLNFYR